MIYVTHVEGLVSCHPVNLCVKEGLANEISHRLHMDRGAFFYLDFGT